eukprot:1160908-Pelagomonas_calceolata.AAC.12
MHAHALTHTDPLFIYQDRAVARLEVPYGLLPLSLPFVSMQHADARHTWPASQTIPPKSSQDVTMKCCELLAVGKVSNRDEWLHSQ